MATDSLQEYLAHEIRQLARQRLNQVRSASGEARLAFLGPPLEVLEDVFSLLVAGDAAGTDEPVGLPVLLQVPAIAPGASLPPVGGSGRCDHAHLLSLRDTAAASSFLALVPPDQHMDLSVATTVDMFGVGARASSAMATFDDWWDDPFVQQVASAALVTAGFGADQRRASRLVEMSARAADDIGQGDGRVGAWRVLARVFASSTRWGDELPGVRLSAACGVPPLDAGDIDPEMQVKALGCIATALGDGFGAGIQRAIDNTDSAGIRSALEEFRRFIQRACDIPTEFETGPSAYYATSTGASLSCPPDWWRVLTCERWLELLEDVAQDRDEVVLEVTNPLSPVSVGGIVIVRESADLRFSLADPQGLPKTLDLERRVGNSIRGLETLPVLVTASPASHSMRFPSHKSPARIVITQGGQAAAAVKVVSLATWEPGIHVQSRTARKLSPVRRVTAKAGAPTLLGSLVLEGAGRHLLDVFLSPGVSAGERASLKFQDGESGMDDAIECPVREVAEGHLNVEVEVGTEADLDLELSTVDGKGSLCRIHLSCDEVKVTGCTSEFDRLVRESRGLKRAAVQADRVARCSVLESWAIEEHASGLSCAPVIIGQDYASSWAQLNWQGEHGPLVSRCRFISDPRPSASEWRPPTRFVEVRRAVLAKIRGQDGGGLSAEATLGHWYAIDPEYRALVEEYLSTYMAWWNADPATACWCDLIGVASTEPGTETLSPRLDAVLMSPLHPVRLAWQCAAQSALQKAIDLGIPCPAASLLDPDVIIDFLPLGLRGPDGVEEQCFVAVESSSDYWGVLWNGDQLAQIGSRSAREPFGPDLGITVGGLARGFSPSQVAKALDDVTSLLPAKSVLSVGLSSSGVGTDSCNEGLSDWSRHRFGTDGNGRGKQHFRLGPQIVEVRDSRPSISRPDEPTLSNLVEDTNGAVRWYMSGRRGTPIDLGIVTQLEASQPTLVPTSEQSALSPGALLRHRIRRQLPHGRQAYVVESRQSIRPPTTGETLLDLLAAQVSAIENGTVGRRGYRFAPDVNAITQALRVEQADFVAVSSSAVDPGCFVGEWLSGAYLWDYSLPSYSQRAGDTSGNYLISRIKEVDRESLASVIGGLPGAARPEDSVVDDLLHEVARRGIPTVRELAGDDSRASGALGMFIAARILQDSFRSGGGPGGLLPVAREVGGSHVVSVVIPVDPFANHIDELSRAARKAKDASSKRPDLLIATFCTRAGKVALKLVPLEVKLRSAQPMSTEERSAALGQAQAFANNLGAVRALGENSNVWRLGLSHLVLCMISFSIRIYAQNRALNLEGREWATEHAALAAAILGGDYDLEIDGRGRLIVIDPSGQSAPVDSDGDGFSETIVVSLPDALRVIVGDPTALYRSIALKLGTWEVEPQSLSLSQARGDPGPQPIAQPSPDPIAPHRSLATDHGRPVSPIPFQVGAQPDEVRPTGREPTQEPVPQGRTNNVDPKAQYGVRLRLGRSTGGFEEQAVSLNISDTRLNQLNIGVVGDLGTGKTQLLKSLILQVATSTDENRGVKPRFLIFDYKKDYSAPDFVAATGAKVVRPFRMPLNIFDTSGLVDSQVPWLERFKFFADVLDKIYSGIGPVQRDKLKQAVKRAYENAQLQGKVPTLYDVHAEYRSILGNKSDAPLSIIDDLMDSEIFAKDPQDGASFGQFFDGVVVISLAALGQDDRTKNMVVALMLNMFYEHMLSLPKRGFVGTDPQLRVIDSYLLVDEADNIMQYEFDVLRKLLLQGREFGVGVVLASQYLRHYKVNSTDYRDPLLTWFVHKVPNVTPAELAGLGLASDSGEYAERIKTLPNHHCLFKSYGGQVQVIRGLPFFELSQVAGPRGS